MTKQFTKRQLLDQCGFTAEETQIILDYQKRLPILVEDEDVDGICINARDLWVQLGEPQGKFADWTKRKFKPYGFLENVDFKPFSQKCEKPQGGRPEKDYLLTLDMAKQLAMIDKKEIGLIARRYFLLMEKAVKKNLEWESERNPLREGYKAMQKALDEYMMRMVQRHADDWDYAFEADAINIIATGLKAKDIRNYIGCIDDVTRDSLTTTYNHYLNKLQEWNILFLGMNMNRYERYSKLKESFDIFFPNAIPIRDDISIEKIIENKRKLLEETKEKINTYN